MAKQKTWRKRLQALLDDLRDAVEGLKPREPVRVPVRTPVRERQG